MVKWRMARHPLFIDDPAVAAALDEASQAAVACLAGLLPELAGEEADPVRQQLRAHLAALLTGKPAAEAAGQHLPALVHGEDAFGDPFALESLPLPRAGTGYAVQLLDTDRLLDRASGELLAVREPHLQGLFDSFESARAAARAWLQERNTTLEKHPLAVVPAFYDPTMKRHVLVFGVLTREP